MMFWFLIFIATPILFFILLWGVVTAVKVLGYDKPIQVQRASTFVRRRTRSRKMMAVAERDDTSRIIDDIGSGDGYILSSGWSSGIPNSWQSDLWIRRN